jgi:hypothetical protein
MLISARCESVSQEIARHPNVSSYILNKLASDRSQSIRLAVAKDLKTSSKTLAKLARLGDRLAVRHRDEYVRRAVAQNPQTPIKILNLLIKTKLSTLPKQQEKLIKLIHVYSRQ